MNAAAEISVFLVDDHSVVREGYRRLLERSTGIRVIGEAANATDAYSEFQRLNPDVVDGSDFIKQTPEDALGWG